MVHPETSTKHPTTTTRRLRRLRHLLPVLLVFGMLVGLAPPVAADVKVATLEPSLAAAIAKDPRKRFKVIVQGDVPPTKQGRKDAQGRLAKLLREKDGDGNPGKIGIQLDLVNGFAADLTGKHIAQLSKNSAIKSISGDHKVKGNQLAVADTSTIGISGTEGTISTSTATLRSMQTIVAQAPAVWSGHADQGQGVTVAILDSGIFPHGDLIGAVHGIDLATSTTALGDPGGHGTHVAGIVAGTGALLSGKYKGAAPQARVLSVKVTNDSGVATYSSLIKGLQWVVAARHAHNIRVVNLSLGATPSVSYKNDPLAAAVELTWFSGVVVVASAGNKGESGTGTITVPANDPYVISVGATNDKNTAGLADDAIATWSSKGPTKYDNLQKPDVVAGGNRVISTRAPNSYIERILGEGRRVDTHYMRLSGTSMAAPVVSGVAALVLAANPALTPNQVKYILKATAKKLGAFGVTYGLNSQGAGQVDANAAVAMARQGGAIPQANTNQRPSDIFARSIYTLAQGAPVSWRDPSYLGRDWSTWSWETGSWDSGSWDNLLWENIDWINASWSSASWDSLTGWTSGSWDSGSWDSGSWDSGAWDSGSWDSGSWDSGSWDSGGWDSGQWDTILTSDEE